MSPTRKAAQWSLSVVNVLFAKLSIIVVSQFIIEDGEMSEADETDDITEELIDCAYEAMCAELGNWSIVGPLEERRPNLPPKEFWNAVRNPNHIIGGEPTDLHHLASRQHAIACVQWHGLRAAIVAVKGELAPNVNTTGDTPTG